MKPKIVKNIHFSEDHGRVVRTLGLHWCGLRFDFLSDQHEWALSKFVRPSCYEKLLCRQRKTKKKRIETTWHSWRSIIHFRANFCLTTWLHIWCWVCYEEIVLQRGTNLKMQNCLFEIQSATRNRTFLLLSIFNCFMRLSYNCRMFLWLWKSIDLNIRIFSWLAYSHLEKQAGIVWKTWAEPKRLSILLNFSASLLLFSFKHTSSTKQFHFGPEILFLTGFGNFNESQDTIFETWQPRFSIVANLCRSAGFLPTFADMCRSAEFLQIFADMCSFEKN